MRIFHLLSNIDIVFSQTLTALNLQINEIGDQGTEYLAKALADNTVTSISVHLRCISLETEIKNIESCTK